MWVRSRCSNVNAATSDRRERTEPLAVTADGIWVTERQRMAPTTAGIASQRATSSFGPEARQKA